MNWVSFDVFRTLGFADTVQLKPSQLFAQRETIQSADWVLFPEYWQLNAIVFGLGARIFPSEASYRIGHNKIEMTRAFELVAPANTPFTLIEGNTPSNADVVWEQMLLPFVAKLPKASQGHGVWLIENRTQWRDYLAKSDVIYAQEYLPINRDIRVVIVGNQAIAAYWRLQSPKGFYNNVAQGGSVDYSPVPPQAIQLALHVAGALGIDHAGFDIAVVGEHPYLIEFNRLFGNQGIPGGDAQLRECIHDYLLRQSHPAGPNYPTNPRPRRAKRVA